MRNQYYIKAINNCDAMIRLNPEDVDAYCTRGCGYAVLDQFERSIQEYNKVIHLKDEAIHLDPINAYAYVLRGNAYEKLGQYEQGTIKYDIETLTTGIHHS